MIGFELTEEQNDLRRLAREFAEREMIPRAREYDEKEIFPRDVCEAAFKAGLMNLGVPREQGGPGLNVLDSSIIIEELNYGCSGMANAVAANELATLAVGGRRQRRAEIDLSRTPGQGTDPLRVRDHRAGRRLRRRRDEHHLSPRRRFLRAQRHQAFHLERLDGGLVRDLRDVGPQAQAQGHLVLRFSGEPRRDHPPAHARQARAARGRYRRDRLRRRAHPRERPGRPRRRGFQIRDGDVRSEPSRNRRDRDRRRAARARRMRQVLAAAPGLRRSQSRISRRSSS